MTDLLIRSKKRLGENSLLSRIYHETRLRRTKMTQRDPILVYQMGKVGSQSIVDSLKAMKLDRPVYHVHFLNRENIQKAERLLHDFYGNHYNVNRWCLYESRFVTKHFLQKSHRTLKIISLVREPIARNISSFFYNIDKFIPDCAVLYEEGRIDISTITRHYLDRFHEHRYPLTWFDEEMKVVFGIDVFADNGDVLQDHRVFVYKRDDIDLLVMRTEDIDEVAEDMLQTFLQMKDFRVKRSNLASDRTYNRLYREFTKCVRLPDIYVKRMYESKYTRFFYSPTEIEGFRARWTAGST